MSERDFVLDSEHFIRWMFCPKHYEAGRFTEQFICLRPKVDDGISGLIHERLPGIDIKAEVYCIARNFLRHNQCYYGYAFSKVGDIRGLALESDSIDVILVGRCPHAEIRFNIDGQIIDKNTPHAKLSYYYDMLKKLFAKQIVVYTQVE